MSPARDVSGFHLPAAAVVVPAAVGALVGVAAAVVVVAAAGVGDVVAVVEVALVGAAVGARVGALVGEACRLRAALAGAASRQSAVMRLKACAAVVANHQRPSLMLQIAGHD